MKREINGYDINNLDDFNTNYIEHYKKFKSNKIKDELNFDTSVQTVQTEPKEDPKPIQNKRTQFFPTTKKEKIKKSKKSTKTKKE